MASSDRSMVCLDDFEKYAYTYLPKMVLDYYKSGADEQLTLADNIQAYRRYVIIPRTLRDVTTVDISTTILGHRITFPVCVAATAMQRMAHPDGEIAAVRGAGKAGTGYMLSTLATSSIEEVAAAQGPGLRFFQLYVYKDRAITKQLIARAEQSGYSAIFLTVDAPVFGKRRDDDRNKFKLPSNLRLANFDLIDVKGSGLNQSSKESGLTEYATSLFAPSITWEDVKWLKTITKLPLVLKGILSAEDALMAVKYGVNGIAVSNHGGRQLDTVPATIDVLREIVLAVDGRCEVYVDGGIRTGTDVLKALSMGAKAVFIGRPVLWGLAYNGQAGVEQVLNILKEEFTRALKLSGSVNVGDLKPSLVRRSSHTLGAA